MTPLFYIDWTRRVDLSLHILTRRVCKECKGIYSGKRGTRWRRNTSLLFVELFGPVSCCLIQDDAGWGLGNRPKRRRRRRSPGSWARLLLPSLILKPPLIQSVKETPPVNPSTCIRCSPTCSTSTSICLPFFFPFYSFWGWPFLLLSSASRLVHCKGADNRKDSEFWQLLETIRADIFLFSSFTLRL